jgi:hypothetical protein
MRGQPASIAFSKVRLGFGIFCVSFLAIAGTGAAYATPITSVNGLVQIDGPSRHGFFLKRFNVNSHGPILDFRSVGRSFTDGSHANASGAAFADFGNLGVAVGGTGTTPPLPLGGVSTIAETKALWDDTITPMGVFLPAGTPVTADLLLNLNFANVAQTFNAAMRGMSYELNAIITQGHATTLVDDCFTINANSLFCDPGSQRFGIPGNTDPGGITLELAPIPLSLAIDQPFELMVSLVGHGEAQSPDSDTFVGAYNFSGDALDTSEAFLQPLGDFTLVSESGHDYSPGAVNGVPEPSSLALLFAGLLSAVRWRRSARSTLRSGSRR